MSETFTLYPASITEFLRDYLANAFPDWRVDHYAGEYPDEEEMKEQVKVNLPNVLIDIEDIDLDEIYTSSDGRSVRDIIHVVVYCAANRKKYAMIEQHIEAVTLAVQVRNSFVGLKVSPVADVFGNYQHSEMVVEPGSIAKTLSNEQCSVYEVHLTLATQVDLDYATE